MFCLITDDHSQDHDFAIEKTFYPTEELANLEAAAFSLRVLADNEGLPEYYAEYTLYKLSQHGQRLGLQTPVGRALLCNALNEVPGPWWQQLRHWTSEDEE